jgi:hypothetical protein
MIQRFGLLVWPDQSPHWRHVDRFPDSTARQTAAQVFDRLSSLKTSGVIVNIDRFGRGDYLGFDANAATKFLDWLKDLELRLRAGRLHVALESHLGKYRKLVPALALINQLTDAGIGPVTVLALDRAIAFARYLETHARRAYGAGLQMDAATAAAILAHIRNGDLADGFTLRDIHQRDWSALTDREQVQAGLDLLLDLDWLAVEKIATGGRPKILYRINPKGKL